MSFLVYMVIFIISAIVIHQIVDFIIKKVKSIFNNTSNVNVGRNNKNMSKSAQNAKKDSLNQSFKSQNSSKFSSQGSSLNKNINMSKRLYQITSQIKKQNLKQELSKNDFSQIVKKKQKDKQNQKQKNILSSPRDEDTINSDNSNYLQRQNSIENNNSNSNKRLPLTRQLKTNMQYINEIHYLKQKNRELNNQKNQQKQTLNELIKDNKRLLNKIDQLSQKLQKKQEKQKKQKKSLFQQNKNNTLVTVTSLQEKQKINMNMNKISQLEQKLNQSKNKNKNLQQKLLLVQKQLQLSKQREKEKEKTHQNQSQSQNQNMIQNLKLVYQSKIESLTATNEHMKQEKNSYIEQIASLKGEIFLLQEANEALKLQEKNKQKCEKKTQDNKIQIQNKLQKQLQQKVNSLTEELMFCQKQLQQTYDTEKQFKKQIEILKRNQLISVHTSPEYTKLREKLVKYEGMITDLQRQLSITQSRERQINFNNNNNQPSYGSNGSSPFQSQYRYQNNKTRYRTIAENQQNQYKPHYNSYEESKILTNLKDSRKKQKQKQSFQNSNDSLKKQSRQRQFQVQFQSQEQRQRKSVQKFKADEEYLYQKVRQQKFNNNERQLERKQKRYSHEIKKQSNQVNSSQKIQKVQKKINKIPSRELLKKYERNNNTNQQLYQVQNQSKGLAFQPIPPVSPVSAVYYQNTKPKREKYKTLQNEQEYLKEEKKNTATNGKNDFKSIKAENEKNMTQLQRIKQNLKNVKDLHRAMLQQGNDKPEQLLRDSNQKNELLYSYDDKSNQNNQKLFREEILQTDRSKQSLKSPYFSKRYTFGQQTFQFAQKQKQQSKNPLNPLNSFNVLTGSRVSNSNVSRSYESQNFRQSSFLLKQDVNYLVRCIGDLKLLAMKSTQLLYTRVTLKYQQNKFGDNPHLHIDNISNILLVCKLVNKKVVAAFTQLPFTKESGLPTYRLKNKSLLIDVTDQIVLTPTGTNLTAYGLKTNTSQQQSNSSTIIYDQKAIIWGRNQLTIKNQEPEVMYSNLGNQYGIYKVQQSQNSRQKKDRTQTYKQYGFKQFLGADQPWIGIEAIQIYRIMFH